MVVKYCSAAEQEAVRNLLLKYQANSFLALAQSYAYPPEHRLHYNWEYRRFFNQSRAFRLPEFTIYRLQTDNGHFRLGITLMARGSSVERNAIKRQIREAFRLSGSQLGSYDYHLVLHKSQKLSHPLSLKVRARLENQFFPMAIAAVTTPPLNA